MLILFILSMGIAATITYLIYSLLRLYYRNYVYLEDSIADIRRWMLAVGDINVFLILFIPLSILIFYILTNPYTTYFNSISQGIGDLARGEFTTKVEITSNDEFQLIAEDINRAAQKLQQATERGNVAESSKDQLVLNLAHDLRTPLTSILGYLEYILQHEDLSDDKSKHYTTIAYTKSKRLEALIDELFEITKMNYGQLTLKITELDLVQLIEQLNEEMYPVYRKQHIATRVSLPESALMHGDGELLARVFENLLTNAVRYGKDGQYIDIEGRVDQSKIVIRITNYGNFIPAEELPFIFDMFYTGDLARTHQAGSTGLGLFIAKNIIEKHQGSIGVKSDVTATIFEIELPIEQTI